MFLGKTRSQFLAIEIKNKKPFHPFNPPSLALLCDLNYC